MSRIGPRRKRRSLSPLLAGLATLFVLGGCGGSETSDRPESLDTSTGSLPGLTQTTEVGSSAPENAAAEKGDVAKAKPSEVTAPGPDPNEVFLSNIPQRSIPFGLDRKQQMADYSLRHYGEQEWRLRNPRLIVEHYAVAPSNDSIFNTFYTNNPDPSYGELPNVCAHFAVDDQGKVIQMVDLDIRCRHVVGLNHTAIGIEHVGYADEDVLGNADELRTSLKLTQALRCRYGIPIENVIGHNESLDSRFYIENVPEFQGQTHGDFVKASMDRYRNELERLGPC